MRSLFFATLSIGLSLQITACGHSKDSGPRAKVAAGQVTGNPTLAAEGGEEAFAKIQAEIGKLNEFEYHHMDINNTKWTIKDLFRTETYTDAQIKEIRSRLNTILSLSQTMQKAGETTKNNKLVIRGTALEKNAKRNLQNLDRDEKSGKLKPQADREAGRALPEFRTL